MTYQSEHITEEKSFKDYIITFTTMPGNATFEVIINCFFKEFLFFRRCFVLGNCKVKKHNVITQIKCKFYLRPYYWGVENFCIFCGLWLVKTAASWKLFCWPITKLIPVLGFTQMWTLFDNIHFNNTALNQQLNLKNWNCISFCRVISVLLELLVGSIRMESRAVVLLIFI